MTWHTASTTSTIGSVNHIAIDPKTPAVLYAATAREVFRSSDSGSTWTKKTTFKTAYEILRIIVDPVTPATLYVYVGGADALAVSTVPTTAATTGLPSTMASTTNTNFSR